MHVNSTDMPTFLALLPRWLAINQHARMPTTGDAGMLGCTPAAQTCQHSWSLPRWLAIDQHASMPAFRLWHAGMLACWSMATSQRGQECWDVCGVCMSNRTGNRAPTYSITEPRRSFPRSMMGGHRPTCHHAGMPACYHLVAGMLGCIPAAQTD